MVTILSTDAHVLIGGMPKWPAGSQHEVRLAQEEGGRAEQVKGILAQNSIPQKRPARL